MSRQNETRLFHVRLSTTRNGNGHQTTTVTTTSHWSRENDCFSGPTGNFGNKHQNREPVTVKSISEMRAVNLHLRSLDERAKFWGP
jgi:hypothetical protein